MARHNRWMEGGDLTLYTSTLTFILAHLISIKTILSTVAPMGRAYHLSLDIVTQQCCNMARVV